MTAANYNGCISKVLLDRLLTACSLRVAQRQLLGS
jgi:hypothetical protein